MKIAYRWVQMLSVVAVLFMLILSLTPSVNMAGKRQEGASTPEAVPNNAYRSPGERHKLAVSDRDLAQRLQKEGARVIADYGSYQLLEVSSASVDALSSNAGAQLADGNNLLLLNSGTIDTSSPSVQAARGADNAGAIDIRVPAGKNIRGTTGGGLSTGPQMRLVQFAGPIQPSWYAALLKTGVRVVTYIPNNGYLVYGNSKSIGAVRTFAATSPTVQWDGDYTSAHRLDRAITSPRGGKDAAGKESQGSKGRLLGDTTAKGNELFAIQLVADEKENATTLALIEQLQLEPIVRKARVLDYVNVVVALEKEAVINQIALRNDVVSIQPWSRPRKFDERQDMVMAGNTTGSGPATGDYLAYLASHGFTTATTSFGVNVSDSGIDIGSPTPNHFGLYALGNPTSAANSRVVYARVVGTPTGPGSTTQGCDGHGNLNGHVVGGYVPTGTVGGVNFGAAPHADAQGFRYGLGVMPFVKLGSSVIFDNSGAPTGDFTDPNYTDLESRAYNDTMRISSNSWGASSNAYSIDSQEYDALVRDAQPTGATVAAAGNQEHIIIFAAGNDGSGPGSVGLPGTAKNVITVGAAEGVQALGGADGCGTTDVEADSINDIVGFSSRGPTADGRRKPDIVAPGTHISGGVAQASIASPAGSGTGDDLACFDATGVCGGIGGNNFFPAGQQWYTASSGTSHSTPAVSGFAALIRQHFINQSLTPPTPAMTKALMLNTARYMTGVGANDSLFSNNQGMGAANFNNYFDTFTTGTVRRDQVAADKFTASGQQRTFSGTINTTSKPFRVTLAWTDTPGPTSGNAFVNNLDLEVIVGGNTYRGNVFSGANSAPGGAADIRNNVESVFIPAGVSGNFLVRVRGTNIAGNGVPGDADALDQDFALVIYNATEANVAVVEGGTLDVTAESCAPADDAISPGETVTVDIPLTNSGTSSTSSLVATLLATGGVTSPSGPQNYGAVAPSGTATRPFTFTADGSLACGANITLTFQLQDGATDLGTVTYVVRLGTLGGASTATYSSGNIATAIPDNTTIEVPVVVNAGGAVSDVNVRVRLNHTFDADVTLSLVAPDGTEVVLSQNNDTALGGGDNYGTGANDCSGTPTIFDDSAATSITAGLPPFAGTFQPESPLSAMNGKSVNGTWKLRVNDNATQDTGTVGCVTLEITRQPFVCCGAVGTPIVASGGAATITAESVTPANNAPDPGESVTISVPLVNTGDGPTTNLVATLQSSGGVTPITTSQTYGAIPPNGTPVSRNFTFVPSGACGSTVTATFQLQDGPTNLGTVTYTFQLGATSTSSQTFSNATAIVLPPDTPAAGDGLGPATPYPSNITVSGVTNPVTAVRVTLKNLSHTFPDDVDVLLVSPTGVKFIVMSDAGDTNDWVGATITLDDAAANSLGDTASNQTGTFRPGNFGTVQDPFTAPAPAGPYLSPAPGGAATFASAFAGQNPNGTWSLYVVDDAAADTGTFAGGWDLTLVSSQNVCNTQACSLSCPANITVPPDGGPSGTSAVVNYAPAGVTGTCNVPSYSHPSGSTFPLGTTNVTVTGAGGATCSFSVTVGTAAPATPGQLLISEFRLRGPSGANDEFIEIYNNTNAAQTVDGSGTGTGYAVAASDGVVRCTIPDGTVIPARGHYLCTNSAAYSLSGNATGNATYTTDIPDNAGIALFNTNVPAEFAVATRLDAVGSTSEANTLYKEGTGYSALTPFSIDYSFRRDDCGKQGSITTLGGCPAGGLPVDNNNNAVDFYFVDTNGTSAGAGQRLGAPGPENLASPIQRNSSFAALNLDGTLGSSSPPNRVRDFTSDPANNSTFGTLDIRKRVVNNTGGAVTRLRFRVVDITTFPAPSGFADLRTRTSTLVVVSGINDAGTCLASNGVATTPCTVNVQGTTLEQPPSQPNGGAFGSTYSVGTVTLGTPLANGASVNVRFLLGIQQTGTFKFFINVEALP